MEPFASLEPNVRAYALVGYYLNGFGMMEHALNECIRKALKLDFAQGVIVTRNMQFRSKVNVLRTLINHAISDPDEQKRYDKFALAISGMGDERNIVAHDWFGPDETGDGISFFVTKAKGKLGFPDIVWSIEQVDDKHSALLKAAETLKLLQPFFTKSDLVRALLHAGKQPAPNSMIGELSLGGLADLLPPSDQDSDPPTTTESTSPQTPEERQE
ncbi:hypothetical protein ABUE31_22565 [Mesorhizobium sp. ZMM04-5]|uniref:Uncharacterized protein n=2 Tax=Mesorhizobium marinum TaxID=3228790 RepID=A0ABV3R7Q7_9HYPH